LKSKESPFVVASLFVEIYRDFAAVSKRCLHPCGNMVTRTVLCELTKPYFLISKLAANAGIFLLVKFEAVS
jgi:hypothetical protein